MMAKLNINCNKQQNYSWFLVRKGVTLNQWPSGVFRGWLRMVSKSWVIIPPVYQSFSTLTWSHLKHPKHQPCPILLFGPWASPITCVVGGWPSSYLPSKGCRQAHVRPQSADAAAAKISTTALEETVRQDPEAGLGLDHFTLKIMYFSKSSPSRGGTLTVMVSHPVLLWFICAFVGRNALQRQDIHYSTLRKPHYLPKSLAQTVQGSWEQGTVWMMLSLDDVAVTTHYQPHSCYTWVLFSQFVVSACEGEKTSVSAFSDVLGSESHILFITSDCRNVGWSQLDVKLVGEEMPRVRNEGGGH